MQCLAPFSCDSTECSAMQQCSLNDAITWDMLPSTDLVTEHLAYPVYLSLCQSDYQAALGLQPPQQG